MTITWSALRRALVDAGQVSPDASEAPAASDFAIPGVAYDSREVGIGHICVDVKGLQPDGSLFVRQAVQRGAVVIVSEHPQPGATIPVLPVRDGRSALAILAAEFYGHPSEKMRVIG